MEHSGHANSVDSCYKKHFHTKKSKTNSALIGRKTNHHRFDYLKNRELYLSTYVTSTVVPCNCKLGHYYQIGRDKD